MSAELKACGASDAFCAHAARLNISWPTFFATVQALIQKYGPMALQILDAVLPFIPAGSTVAEILAIVEQLFSKLNPTPAPTA